jgi:hypothetical protein
VREWWLRTVLVVTAPRAVFAALRDDSPEAAATRAEPVLAIVWLAGIAFVLATRTAAPLMDDQDYDGLIVAVWVFLAGGLYGAVAYYVLGGVLHRAAVLLGSQGSYRRARHILAFASVPVALSLVLWPVKLALWGSALFHRGGPDSGGGGTVFELLLLGFLAWAICLLVVGVAEVHGWTWGRAAAASAAPVALGALVLLL